MQGLRVVDDYGDTLANIGYLRVNVLGLPLAAQPLSFNNVDIIDSKLNLIRHSGANELNLQRLIDQFVSKSDPDKEVPDFVFSIKSVELENFKFRLWDQEMEIVPALFQPGDIQVDVNRLFVTDFLLINDSINLHLSTLTGIEKSGFTLENIACDMVISSNGLFFDNLNLYTQQSYLNGFFRMHFDSWRDFGHFNDSVIMEAQFYNSDFDFLDLGYFNDNIKDFNLHINLNGEFKGSLSKIKAPQLDIRLGENTSLLAKIEITGLPDIDNTLIYTKIQNLVTDYNDLSSLNLPDGSKLKLPTELRKLGTLGFNGVFSGFLQDFNAYGQLSTVLGNAKADFNLITQRNTVRFNGNLSTSGFDVGRLVGQYPLIKKTSLNVNFDGTSDSNTGLSLNVSGNINSLDLNQYIYRDIQVSGNISNNVFTGNIDVVDPHLFLKFNGSVDYGKKIPQYDFSASIFNTDLYKLNILPKDSIQDLSVFVKMDISGSNLDNLVGEIKAQNLIYKKSNSRYQIKDLSLVSTVMNQDKHLKIRSDVLDLDVMGDFEFIPLFEDIQNNVSLLAPSLNLTARESKIQREQNLDFKLILKDITPISEVFVPQFKISNGAKLDGHYSTDKGLQRLRGNADFIKYGNLTLDEWFANGNSESGVLFFTTGSNVLYIGDSLGFNDFQVRMSLVNDSLNFNIKWFNDDGLEFSGMLYGYSDLSKNPEFTLSLDYSSFVVNNVLWNVTEGSKIVFNTKEIEIHNLLINSSDERWLKAFGKVSQQSNDAITLDFNDIPLDFVNPFIASSGIHLHGELKGRLRLFDIFENPYLTSELGIEEFRVNDLLLGRLSLLSIFNQADKSITINSSIFRGNLETIKIVDSKYYPFAKDNNLDLSVNLNNFQATTLNPLVQPNLNFLRGFVSGRLRVTGTANSPSINGLIQLQSMSFNVPFTGTSYSITTKPDKSLIVENNYLEIRDVSLTDERGNLASVDGNVNLSDFNNITLNLVIDAKRFKALSTNALDNDLFYGTAIISGISRVSGSIYDLKIDSKIRTEAGTRFFIPITNDAEVKVNNFVYFIKPDEPEKKQATKEESEYKFTLNIDAEVTPDAELQIIFDEMTGDILRSTGSGNLRIEVLPEDFRVFGEYTISRGDYLFTLENIVNKRLALKQGSTIIFSGDPYNANIDATAIYRLRTSLFELMAAMSGAEQEAFRQRIPVETYVMLKGVLMNPEISFDIFLPTVDENTRNRVKSLMNTQDEMNKQAFSLLVFNRFAIPGHIGSGQNDLVAGNTAEMLSNQLSNWLSQLSNDFDIGVKYRSGNDANREELEVALSTRLFNDRVILDGNLGVMGNNPNQAETNRNFMGEFNVDVKITRDGKLRWKIFNRSNEANLIKVANYTQGSGIAYQRQFDRVGDLFIRKRKKNELNKDLPPIDIDNDYIFDSE